MSYPVAADNLAVANSQAQHIAGVHESKVLANGVHPDQVGKLGIAHADVAGDALGVAIASPATEDGCHVQHNVLAVLMERRKGGDA